MKKKNLLADSSYELMLIVILACWFMFMGAKMPNFVSMNNLVTVLTRLSDVAIISIGMTIVIIAGGFDLAVGTTMAFIPAVIGILYGKGIPFAACVSLGFILALALGLLNGVLITKAKIQPMIGTLATMTAFRSITYVITNGMPVRTLPKGYEIVSYGKIGGVFPIPIAILIVVTILAVWIMNHTVFGRFVYAVGGNKEAAKISGVNVDRVIIFTYVVSSVLSSLAGMIYASRTISVSPEAGSTTNFDVVTAVLLGGTSIQGGKGKIQGTLIGVIILNFIVNGFNLLGINAYWQKIFMGAVLLAAVGFDSLKGRHGIRRSKRKAIRPA